MGFIDSYKQLEKLCGEILRDDRRISAYIDEMIKTSRGAFYVSGWEDDLKQLKHYRCIRNKIAHEPGCSEENMCVPTDTMWLNNFYSRIMNQTDPLALYRKATSRLATVPNKKTPSSQTDNKKHMSGCALCMILVFAVVIVIVAFILSTILFSRLFSLLA